MDILLLSTDVAVYINATKNLDIVSLYLCAVILWKTEIGGLWKIVTIDKKNYIGRTFTALI